jgi:hypothetical protein
VTGRRHVGQRRRVGAAGLAATALGGVITGTVIAGTLIAGTIIAAAPPASAAAEPTGDCTTTSGVIVAVDFAHFGGPVLRSCGSTPTSAYTLLNQGGWHTTGTEHDGPGFICRIGYAGYHGGAQYPTPSQQACVLTPPTSAYWAFWYANPGQRSWNYSQTGAIAVKPEPGSVELWVFGGTSSGGTSGSAVPTVSPASLRAQNTRRPGTVHHRVQQHRTTAPAGQTTPAGQATTATRPAAGAAPSSPPAAHSSGATPSGQATIRDAQPKAATAPASHGSATPAIIALVIVLVLAGAGITAVLRRPRRER